MNGDFDVVITPDTRAPDYWRDLWRHRDLFLFLAWRDLLVRYKQTLVGVAWSVVRPTGTIVVFTLVFEKFARLPSEGNAPYPLLVFSAMLPWQLFVGALNDSSNSLLASASVISKVYFPRLIVPVSAMMASIIDFLISFVLLLLLMLWYEWPPTIRFALLPIFLFPALLAAMGIGVGLGALNVKYRDVRYVVPFMLQLGLYLSPVGFSSSLVPSQWRLLYSLNPMVGVIDGFRWVTLGTTALYWPSLLMSAAISILLFTAGLAYFRRTEQTFADVI